ncbi:MAG: hypothetical protein ACOC0O_06720 [Spirochaetota bacterium]
MFTLENDALSVSVLDPVADCGRMGPRYCTGGYVFQIHSGGDPLLSGPTYPDDFNWFDGQGIPDSFAHAPLRNPEAPGPLALIPGIGVCDTAEPRIVEHCEWEIERSDLRLRLSTEHDWKGYALTVERVVELSGRVIVSSTTVENRGRVQFPIAWFPHPFFPVPDDALCSFPAPIELPENTTYYVGADRYLRCRDLSVQAAVPLSSGASGSGFTVLQRHPESGIVAARFDYPVRHVIVWGNTKTFSFEPYLERTVGVGASLTWNVEYHF